MQAILMDQSGSAEMLRLGEVPTPELPGPSHLRVRLKAAGVNPLDTKLRKNGTYFPERLPTILGCDGAGVVESAGAAADIKLARTRNQSIHFELMLTPMYLGMHDALIAQRRILEQGAGLIEQGQLEILVNRTFPLEQAAAAHLLIEEGHTAGKIVLEI